MTWTVDASGTQTATIGTEHQLDAAVTNSGTYVFGVDANALALGDLLELRVYDVIASTLQQVWKGAYQHPQINPGKLSPPLSVLAGAKFTLKQVAGTGRSFPWIVRRQFSAALPVTWSAADKTAITLSNGMLTARYVGAGTNDAVRATASISTSKKYYFEVVADAVPAGPNPGTGHIVMADAAFILTANPDGNASDSCTWRDDRNFFSTNFAGTGSSPGAWGTVSKVIGIAVDGTNKKIWGTFDGTTWNAGGAASPATNNGGASLSALSFPLFPLFSSISFGYQVTARFDPASFTLATLGSGSLAGFSQWGS